MIAAACLGRKRDQQIWFCQRTDFADCIAWVPFNEAWGQFKTPEIAEWTKEYDPTRLVNPASGGNHYTDVYKRQGKFIAKVWLDV